MAEIQFSEQAWYEYLYLVSDDTIKVQQCKGHYD